MAHKVICTYCKQQFDRDKEAAVPTKARRYAHAACALKLGNLEEQALAAKVLKDKTQEVEDLEQLEKYIIELLRLDYVNARVRAQINKFHDENHYTYTGIQKSLMYFYEVKNNPVEKANGGIGIVPYVYEDARNYYTAIWQAQQINQAKPIEQYIAPPERVIVVGTPQPHMRTQRKLFTFLDEEEDDGV